MATCGEWITKSTRIGASLGGVAGFSYAAYIMATSPTLRWTDVLDTVGSVVAVLIFAVIIGSFCIGIGGLAGLVLGIVASPLSSFTVRETGGRNEKAKQPL
jgi:apolipoprotein N-acyltransferase